MINRKKSSQKIDEAVGHSLNFEVTVSDLARRSERRAWWVAFTAVALSLILAGGYFYMLPLKEKVPYIVMADAYTGTSTMARLTDDYLNQHITASEAINRSNVAHFVLAREAFDVGTINQHDWPTVLTMAARGVGAEYTQLHSPQNPNSPFKQYGKDRAIRVKILSIVLVGGGQGSAPTGATVRFQRTLYNKINGQSTPMDSKLATLAFTYKANLVMDDQARVENPLGFQVSSYRVDNDYASSAPEEVPGAAAPANAPNAAPATQDQSAAAGNAAQPDETLQPINTSQSPIPDAPGASNAAPPATGTPVPAQRNTPNGVGRR